MHSMTLTTNSSIIQYMSYYLTLNFKEKKSEIVIESGLLKKMGRLLKEHYPGKRIMIVTDETVYSIYGPTLEEQIKETESKRALLILPFGEASKTQETLFSIYSKLLEERFTRDDVIISFGGGAVGDVTGLAASTYLRGIHLIHLPTTLTAQADSSIGGKNAINLPQGKNLVGTFYQPEHIWIDPKFLRTLDKQDMASGMAEVIKYALISDMDFFEELLLSLDLSNLSVLEDIIYKCCMIKKSFVEEDEHETDKRIILNFGHTIGHGIERYYDYNITHGEAVAMGMYTLTAYSEKQGLTKKGTAELIRDLLNNYDLPFALPENIDKKRLYEMTLHDKKNRGSEINLITLTKIGEPIIHTIEHDKLMEFLI